MEKCNNCYKEYTVDLTDASTGTKEYYCEECLLMYLDHRLTIKMPDFLYKYIEHKGNL